jgi:hypothetical protein
MGPTRTSIQVQPKEGQGIPPVYKIRLDFPEGKKKSKRVVGEIRMKSDEVSNTSTVRDLVS